MTHAEKLQKGIELLRSLHVDLIDLELHLVAELANHPMDSGFSEAMEDVREHWSKFNELFGED
jgi:hypothetical protein